MRRRCPSFRTSRNTGRNSRPPQRQALSVRESGGAGRGVNNRETNGTTAYPRSGRLVQDGQKGSHMHFRHAVKPGLLVVPMHAGKDRQGTASQYSEEGGIEMTREYLVVYEKGGNNWSAFSPDSLDVAR